MRTTHVLVPIALAISAFVLGGCGMANDVGTQERVVPGGDAERGAHAIRDYGCASCHAIAGIPGADDESIAPDLHDFGDRYYIAGHVPNRPEELIEWLRNPQDIAPGTLMPDLGVTEQDARDIAAYLYGE